MKKHARFALGLIVALGAFYYTIHNLSVEELTESILKVDNIYLIFTALIMTVCYIPRAFRWQLLLSPIKYVRISELLSPMMIGFVGNFLPGRVGELLRAYLFGKKFKVSIISSFATIVVERLFDLIIVIILFAWILVFQKEVFNPDISFLGMSVQNIAINFGKVAFFIIIGLIIFIYLLIFRNNLLISRIYWVIQILPNNWQDMIVGVVRRFSLGLESLRHLPSLLKVITHTFLIWIFTVSAFYPLTLAFELQEKSIGTLVLLRAMVSILIVILPTPAYLGSFNAGIFIVLHEILGESEVVAASFGLVAWSLNTFVVFISGVILISYDWIQGQSLKNIDK